MFRLSPILTRVNSEKEICSEVEEAYKWKTDNHKGNLHR